jgi:hypothetical protein
MTDKDDSYGYGDVDKVSASGRYLSFGKGDKGRTIQVRLTSRPKYVLQHWIGPEGGRKVVKCEGDDCKYCGKDVPPKERVRKDARWGWIVIDREIDLNKGVPIKEPKVKLFTGPTLIAKKIKKLAENKQWGNPLLYDIVIERTEDPGAAYYEVTPVPDGKGKEITKKEKEAVKVAGFDLEAELEGGMDSDNTGSYKAEDLEEELKKSKDLPF